MTLGALLRRGELYAIGLAALSLAAFAGVSALGDGEKLRSAIARVDGRLVLGLAGLALVNYLLRAARFQLLARRLGIIVPFGSMLLCYVAGFSMSATPGKLGELVRLWLIRRRHGYSIERGLPLQIVDRTMDVLASAVLCVAAISGFEAYRLLVLPGAAIIAVAVAMLAWPGLLLWMVNLAYRLVARRGRLFARIRRMVRSTSQLFEPRLFAVTLLLSVLGWGAECLGFDLAVRAVTGAGDFGHATFIFTFANLAGGLTFLPGGVGTTEVSMVGLLAASGASIEDAATATAVIRFATLWFGILVGIVATAVIVRLTGRDSTKLEEVVLSDGGAP